MATLSLKRRAILGAAAKGILAKKGPLTSEERNTLREINLELEGLEVQVNAEHRRKVASAFRNWLRLGWQQTSRQPGISEEERSILSRESQERSGEFRDLATGGQAAYPGATAGFFAPTEFNALVTSSLKDYGPLLRAGTVIETQSGAPRAFPSDNDATVTGEQIAESTQVTDADIPLSQIVLGAFKYSSRLIKVSIELLQDGGFDVEQYLADRLAVRLSRILNAKFTVGVGTTEPFGIITQATSAGTAVGANSNDGVSGPNTIGSDDLTTLEKSVDPAYRRNASYMLHPNTLAHIRSVKDKQGHPVFPADGTLNGYSVLTNPNMAELQSTSSSPTVTRTPLLFGDFGKYVIRLAPLQIMRLGTRFADFGQVGFVGILRADGNLIDGSEPLATPPTYAGSVKSLQTIY